MVSEDKFEIENAVIESAKISIKRGFILSAYLNLNYCGSGQGFGGFGLYLGEEADNHKLESVAGHFIYRCLKIAGVESWDDLEGKTIRADHSWGEVRAIGHIIKDDWFNPKEDFKALKKVEVNNE